MAIKVNPFRQTSGQKKRVYQIDIPLVFHSHSMVAGGFEEMS